MGGAYGGLDLGGFTTNAISTSSLIDDAAPFALYSLSFTALTSGTLVANIGQVQGETGSNDSVGPILDQVTLSVAGAAVPGPAAWATMLLGLGLAGAALRGRRQATLVA